MCRIWLALVLVLAIAGTATVSWLLGSALSAPVPREIGPLPSTLPGATAVSFPSASGSRIRAWFAPGRLRVGSVVLAHAVRSDRRSMLGRAEFLHGEGYSVLLFDAQAHGESPGERITFGYLEALDAAAAVSFAAARDPDSPVAFLGVSQGGAAALLGPSPLPVSALVLEAVYSTVHEAVANRMAIRFGEPGRLLAPLLLWQLEPRLGVSPEKIAPISGIRDIEAPLLLLAGERDRHSPIEQSLALFRAAPEPKELWVVPGAAHQDFHLLLPREYERRILDFLNRALGRTAGREAAAADRREHLPGRADVASSDAAQRSQAVRASLGRADRTAPETWADGARRPVRGKLRQGSRPARRSAAALRR